MTKADLLMIAALLLATGVHAQTPPRFGPHPYPAQQVATRNTSSCGKVDVVVEVDQAVTPTPSRSIKITIGAVVMPAPVLGEITDATSRLPWIVQVGVSCADGRPVDITFYGPDPTGDKVRALLDGAKIVRVD